MFLQFNCSAYPIPTAEPERPINTIIRQTVIGPISCAGFVGNVLAIWLWCSDKEAEVKLSETIFMFKIVCVCANVDLVIFNIWVHSGFRQNGLVCDVGMVLNMFMVFLFAYNVMMLMICRWLDVWPSKWRRYTRGRRPFVFFLLFIWCFAMVFVFRYLLSHQSVVNRWKDLVIYFTLGTYIPTWPVTLILVFSNWWSHRRMLRVCGALGQSSSSFSDSQYQFISGNCSSVQGLTYSSLCTCSIYVLVSVVTLALHFFFVMEPQPTGRSAHYHNALVAYNFFDVVVRSINCVIYAIFTPRFRMIFKWKFSRCKSGWPVVLPPLKTTSGITLSPGYRKYSCSKTPIETVDENVLTTSIATMSGRIEENIAIAKIHTQELLAKPAQESSGIDTTTAASKNSEKNGAAKLRVSHQEENGAEPHRPKFDRPDTAKSDRFNPKRKGSRSSMGRRSLGAKLQLPRHSKA